MAVTININYQLKLLKGLLRTGVDCNFLNKGLVGPLANLNKEHKNYSFIVFLIHDCFSS